MGSGGSSAKALGILLAALLSPLLAAQAAEPPRTAPPEPDTRTALIDHLTPAAQRGDPQAQYELGALLKDPAEAFKWFRKAAEQGQADAQHRLAQAYFWGIGVGSDKAEGIKWYRRAAEQGQVHAQLALGELYHYGGPGLPKDAVEAVRWYRRAAEQNNAAAQAALGDAYALGQGVARDDGEAIAWYRRAVAQSHPLGQVGLGQMYAAGRGVARDEQEAARQYDQAAHQNVVTAMVLLGQAYAQGQGVRQDRARAYYWLALAARLGETLDDATKARDELASRLSPGELAEGQRMLATTAPPAGEPQWAPLLGSPAEMPKQADFCASLARVMAASAASFEPLRGKAREDKGWDATETLPGTHGCAIGTNDYFLGPLHDYECVISSEDDDAVAGADLEGMRSLVSHCLGESWRVDETRNSDKSFERRNVYFTSAAGAPSLTLSDWKNLDYSSRHRVRLRVEPPGVTVTLKGRRAGKAIDLNAPVDIKAREESVADICRAVAEALEISSIVDPEAHGRATLERKDMPLHEALDAVCAQADCVWYFRPEGLYMMKRQKS
jgi:uncharacterized protein